jgi:hypothetical protein
MLAIDLLLTLLGMVLLTAPHELLAYAGEQWLDTGIGTMAAALLDAGQEALTAVNGIVLGALSYIATTLFYYDLRVRKEAFDLEHAATSAAPEHAGTSRVTAAPEDHPKDTLASRNTGDADTVFSTSARERIMWNRGRRRRTRQSE